MTLATRGRSTPLDGQLLRSSMYQNQNMYLVFWSFLLWIPLSVTNHQPKVHILSSLQVTIELHEYHNRHQWSNFTLKGWTECFSHIWLEAYHKTRLGQRSGNAAVIGLLCDECLRIQMVPAGCSILASLLNFTFMICCEVMWRDRCFRGLWCSRITNLFPAGKLRWQSTTTQIYFYLVLVLSNACPNVREMSSSFCG